MQRQLITIAYFVNPEGIVKYLMVMGNHEKSLLLEIPEESFQDRKSVV